MKNIHNQNLSLVVMILFISITSLLAQKSDEIKIESNIFDTGKMWTFDFPPTQYLNETYSFAPDDEWFDDVRLSALRIPGCSASFVSENGLIMTNNHCSTWHRNKVQLEGENLELTGFYAKTMDEERKVPNMYAEQLAFIMDVTNEVNSAIDSGKTDEEKVNNKSAKVKELVEYYNNETDLKCQFVTLFNGGKYSIYGYKRYNDVRLVFVPEQSIASFGGDYDNFTYPRYDLDCGFFRVYDDDGKPVNSEHFFQFSDEGVQKNEVIFSVGNPGRTNRLNTVSQLEYNRDVSYRNRAFLLDSYYSLLEDLKSEYPDRADEFEKIRNRIGNGQKVFHYTEAGLQNSNLIARKKDFENKLIAEVKSRPELNEKYGHIWSTIKTLREELKPIDSKLAVYKPSRFFGAVYFKIAKDIITYAKQMQLPEKERSADYSGINLDSLKTSLYPNDIDDVLELSKLQIQLDFIRLNLGDDNEFVQKLCGDNYGAEAVKTLMNKSILADKEKTSKFLEGSPEEILNSEDPIIYFVKNTQDKIDDLSKRSNEIKNTEDVLVNMLGRVLFDIYGTEIPPDANFTLRLSDGILSSFNYNGTKAVEKSTFYGLYNRYYGSDKTYPWNLPERWKEPPANFDLSTTFNFISSNDIVGGNSGSAVINKNAEVVGLAFDGNTESIVGNFIYLPENNRMVSVASQAIIESLDKVYKADRIVKELKTGEMAE